MTQSRRQTSPLWLLCSAAFLLVLSSSTTRTEKSSSCSLLPLAQAFVPVTTLLPGRRFQQKLYGTKDTQPKQEAQFEYQELVAQLDEMLSRNIPMTRLTPQKQQELQQYTRAVATKRISSSVPSSDNLQSTSWKLVFSTQSLLATELPADATVGLEFLDASTLNYNLDFGKKTFGLNKLTAKSQYTIDVSACMVSIERFFFFQMSDSQSCHRH